jgi:hypothetical protein
VSNDNPQIGKNLLIYTAHWHKLRFLKSAVKCPGLKQTQVVLCLSDKTILIKRFAKSFYCTNLLSLTRGLKPDDVRIATEFYIFLPDKYPDIIFSVQLCDCPCRLEQENGILGIFFFFPYFFAAHRTDAGAGIGKKIFG